MCSRPEGVQATESTGGQLKAKPACHSPPRTFSRRLCPQGPKQGHDGLWFGEEKTNFKIYRDNHGNAGKATTHRGLTWGKALGKPVPEWEYPHRYLWGGCHFYLRETEARRAWQLPGLIPGPIRPQLEL